jgi:hypothetical protein
MESRWTVSSDVMSRVLKSAMPSVPLATVPPDQLLVADQRPPLVVSVHVPLVARARVLPIASAIQMIVMPTTRPRPMHGWSEVLAVAAMH